MLKINVIKLYVLQRGHTALKNVSLVFLKDFFEKEDTVLEDVNHFAGKLKGESFILLDF